MSGPQFVRFFGPVLSAIKQLGGSGRPEEVRNLVAEEMNISEEQQAEVLQSGGGRFDNQVQWARFYLVKAGYLDSSRRGVWSLTDKGRAVERITAEQARALHRQLRDQFVQARRERGPAEEAASDDGEPLGSENYRERLLRTLLNLPPAGFERFCQRLLRESGFQEVTVTGRSGDGGIDGIGILQVNSLVSFKVLFQCKRYSGAVVPSQVRDFRGAMTGRADKGIILTTGTFTTEAKREAIRDGAPSIELVDGEKLIHMLEDLELGLVPKKTFEVNTAFFRDFES